MAGIGKSISGAASTFRKYNDFLLTVLLRIILVTIVLIMVLAALGCLITSIGPGGGERAGTCGVDTADSMLRMGGNLLGFAAALFDITLTRYLLRAGEFLGRNGAFGEGIAGVWTILRDLVNLVLIGGLIWASISMILRIGQNVGKLIVQIIIAALLVNFSFFFAGAILDASHFASQIVYQEAFLGGVTPTAAEQNEGVLITERIMNAFRLGTIYNPDGLELGTIDWGTGILLGGIGLLFFGITAWIFLSMAGLFIQRFIVIVVLLMTAPIGILRFTDLPTAKDLGQGWWAALYSQAVFPPVFLILTAAALRIVETAVEKLEITGNLTGIFLSPTGAALAGGGAASAASSGAWGDAWELVTIFIMGVGLFYAAMKVSTNIARQEPLKVPTTGQFYGAYKGAFKTGMNVAKTTGSTLGKIPLPLLRSASGRSYKNIGDFITGGPERGGLPALSRVGRQGQEAWKARQDDYENKLNAFLLAKKAHERGEISDEELERKRQDFAFVRQSLPEDHRGYNDDRANKPSDDKLGKEQREAGVTDDDRAQAVAEADTENLSGIIRQQTTATGTAPTSTSGGPTAKLAKAINDADSHEQIRDNREMSQQLRLARRGDAAGRAAAQALITEMRKQNISLAKLPEETLTSKNFRKEITVNDLLDVGRDTKNFTYDQYENVLKAAPRKVRREFLSGPGRYGRPVPQISDDVDVEEGLGDGTGQEDGETLEDEEDPNTRV